MSFKHNRKFPKTLRNKLLNTLMRSGKKNITEKILLNSVKHIYKLNSLNLKNLLSLSFINVISVFKLNEQVVKKGKRKMKKQIPFFLIGDSNRIVHGLKTIHATSFKTRKSEEFYKSLSRELLSLASEKSISISKNNDIKDQVLLNKRHLSKFRW